MNSDTKYRIQQDANYALRRNLHIWSWQDNSDSFKAVRFKSPTELKAIATRIEQVADFFEANPDLRAKDTLMDGRKVCAIGAVHHARQIGLKWNPFASKNCKAEETITVMDMMGHVALNDSPMPAEQFRNWLRRDARVIRDFAALKDRSPEAWYAIYRKAHVRDLKHYGYEAS